MEDKIFLYAYEELEFNRKKYFKKPLKSKKYTERVNVYLENIAPVDLPIVKNELHRGRKFFDQDGLLLGAYVKLLTLGTILKEHTNGNSSWIERTDRKN